MAKTPFSKLKLTKKEDIKTITFNGQEIEIKQYLPTQDKLELIANVLNNSADDNNFANPVKVDVFTVLEILYKYTNLSFTDKQKEDIPKLFDLVETNGLIDAVLKEIPELEYNNLIEAIDETIKSYYEYKNSALGILDVVATDYSNLELDASKIQNEISDPENLKLLKGVMKKLG